MLATTKVVPGVVATVVSAAGTVLVLAAVVPPIAMSRIGKRSNEDSEYQQQFL